jgi:hypothetical protein
VRSAGMPRTRWIAAQRERRRTAGDRLIGACESMRPKRCLEVQLEVVRQGPGDVCLAGSQPPRPPDGASSGCRRGCR